MNKKQAISALEKQKEKLFDDGHYNDESWVFQTISLSEDIFGKDSAEYVFFSQVKFYISHQGYDSSEDILFRLRQNEKKVGKFIDNCIETINYKGVYRKPKTNFLQKFNDWQMLGAICSLVVVSFWIGVWVGGINKSSISAIPANNKSSTDTAQKKK